ncbi:MAG: hypothetical protein LQ338_001259 [Usnochroma carphineum]|nr:MAG: hypothetical protein LQ338_001259 [Usnochroma carphineum]
MSLPTVTVIGSLNTDLITRTTRLPKPGETLTSTSFSTGCGGKGANQAVACARLSRSMNNISSPSVNVRMVGAVGEDTFGKDLVTELESNGIDASGVRLAAREKTGTAVVIVEEDTGENRILINPGANYSVLPSTFSPSLFSASSLPSLIILQLEILVHTVVHVIHAAKEAGVPVLLNPAPAVGLPSEIYSGMEHLILNETEAQLLAEIGAQSLQEDGRLHDACEYFLTRGVRNVVITMGADGVYWKSKNHAVVGNTAMQHVTAAKVEKVVDTTAAGDTFVGAYAVGISSGMSVDEAVRWANQAAAKTVEKEGAQDAIPWRDEVPPPT